MSYSAMMAVALLCGVGFDARTMTDDDAKAKAIAAERKLFEGTWRVASMEVEGVAVPEEQLKDSRLTLKGDEFFTGKDGAIKGTYAIDPTAKPKTIDVTITLPDGRKRTHSGIYELDAETYKVSMGSGPDKPRPTEFASKPGSGNALQILKRIKP
jgi:uncharacterized protein (TIGR03067 family)